MSQQQVLRVDEVTHREVSQYAARVGKSMRDVNDNVVRAGLAVLSERASIAPNLKEYDEKAVGEEYLRAALPVEAIKIATDYQRDLATRKRVEVVSLAESVARLVASGIKRLSSSTKHARGLRK